MFDAMARPDTRTMKVIVIGCAMSFYSGASIVFIEKNSVIVARRFISITSSLWYRTPVAFAITRTCCMLVRPAMRPRTPYSGSPTHARLVSGIVFALQQTVRYSRSMTTVKSCYKHCVLMVRRTLSIDRVLCECSTLSRKAHRISIRNG